MYKKILFEVQDSGIGIKDEDKHKLFKIFGKIEQKDNKINPSGIGLGLTICNKILNQLDSQLSVYSIFGEGTTFSFTLDLPMLDLQLPFQNDTFISNND